MSKQAETAIVLQEVLDERMRQEAKWGPQNHPLWAKSREYAPGTLSCTYYGVRGEHHAKALVAEEVARGEVTYFSILVEEVAEAVEAKDEARARAELVQVAAVAVAMIEAIDRRSK
jgi:hypothetical protein